VTVVVVAAPTPTDSLPTGPSGPTGPTPPPATVTETQTATQTQTATTGPTATATVTTTPATPSSSASTAATPTPSPTGGSSSGSNDLGVIIAIAAAVVVLVALFWYLIHRAGAARHAAATGWDDSFERLRATTRWFAEQVAIDATDPGTPPMFAARTWGEAQPVVLDLERNWAELARRTDDQYRAGRAQALAAATTDLRGAVEANLRIRGAPNQPGQDLRLRDSAQRVAASRYQLQGLLAGPAPGAGTRR
jgi:hypothetical protein